MSETTEAQHVKLEIKETPGYNFEVTGSPRELQSFLEKFLLYINDLQREDVIQFLGGSSGEQRTYKGVYRVWVNKKEGSPTKLQMLVNSGGDKSKIDQHGPALKKAIYWALTA